MSEAYRHITHMEVTHIILTLCFAHLDKNRWYYIIHLIPSFQRGSPSIECENAIFQPMAPLRSCPPGLQKSDLCLETSNFLAISNRKFVNLVWIHVLLLAIFSIYWDRINCHFIEIIDLINWSCMDIRNRKNVWLSVICWAT